MRTSKSVTRGQEFIAMGLYKAICIWIICMGFPLEFFGQTKELPLMKFGIISDVQYADRDDVGSRNYRGSLDKLVEAVQTFNDNDVNFVISLGDFIDGGFTNFDTLLSITNHLKMPLYHVLGNHDFTAPGDPLQNTLSTLGLKKKSYYTKVHKNWRFIMLDGNDISLYANSPDSPEYEEALSRLEALKSMGSSNAMNWNGAISQKQLNWFARELKKAQRLKQKCIVFCHFPVNVSDSYQLWNAQEINAIIDRSPAVIAYFNGHVHKSQYKHLNDVHFVTFAGMVEKGDNAFAIVSVYKERIEITGFGKEESRVITFR